MQDCGIPSLSHGYVHAKSIKMYKVHLIISRYGKTFTITILALCVQILSIIVGLQIWPVMQTFDHFLDVSPHLHFNRVELSVKWDALTLFRLMWFNHNEKNVGWSSSLKIYMGSHHLCQPYKCCTYMFIISTVFWHMYALLGLSDLTLAGHLPSQCWRSVF